MDVKSEGEVRDDVTDLSEMRGSECLSRDTVSFTFGSNNVACLELFGWLEAHPSDNR